MKKVVKIIINTLLIFLMMFSILYSTILCIIMRYSNKEKMISTLENVKIYHQIYEEIENGFENYIYQSGLEIVTLAEICNEEKVKKDVLAIVDNVYEGSEVKIDTSDIIKKLDEKIKKSLEAEGKTVSEEEQENIEEFEIIVVNSYGNNLSKYMDLTKFVKDEKVKNAIDKCAFQRNIAIVVTVVIGALIILVNRKNMYYGIGYIGSVLLASGIILTLARFVVYQKVKFEGIMIFTQIISSLVVYLVKEILSSINSVGIWYICIGIFIILMISILGIDAKKKTANTEKDSAAQDNQADGMCQASESQDSANQESTGRHKQAVSTGKGRRKKSKKNKGKRKK